MATTESNSGTFVLFLCTAKFALLAQFSNLNSILLRNPYIGGKTKKKSKGTSDPPEGRWRGKVTQYF